MKRILFLLMLFLTTKSFAQDIIVKPDGTIIKSKVLEVGLDEVKYKKSSNLKGPVYTLSKKEILKYNL